MKIAISKIAILFLLLITGKPEIISENKLDFQVNKSAIFSDSIQMFISFLDKHQNLVRCDHNGSADFQNQILPLDVHNYFKNRGDESYYTLLTKTVYGLNQHVSFFTGERLSNEKYLQEIMPENKLKKNQDNYFLQVGFGAPDITYSLGFYTNCELLEKFPSLVKYFNENDNMEKEPSITVFQHNHTFSKVLGQETTKMSMSITRYFEFGEHRTIAINYTLNFIHNLPPEIFGGGKLLINQMKEGVIALVRDTNFVCKNEF